MAGRWLPAIAHDSLFAASTTVCASSSKRFSLSREVGPEIPTKEVGRVAAAGLDSFAREPMQVPHSFRGQPGFVLSPHIGGVTSAAYVNMGVAAANNTLAVLHRLAEQHTSV
ncbi:hypothetical protein D9M68_536860 [compost metagenome]